MADEMIRDAQLASITAAIKAFPFWNYGLDEANPNSEYAEWVPDLAAKIQAAVTSGETRTEFGARFEGGEIMARPSRELAERTVQAINGRGGDSALMVRQIITTDWTEAEVSAEPDGAA